MPFKGELVGPGIQSNRYQLKHTQLFVFNIFDIESNGYLPKTEVKRLCKELGLEEVPFVAEQKVPTSIDDTLSIAEGKSVLNSAIEREGLVWVCGSGKNRISFKTISNKFLCKAK